MSVLYISWPEKCCSVGGLVLTLFDHVSSVRSHWDTTLDEADIFLINLIYGRNHRVDLLLSKQRCKLLIQSVAHYFQQQMFYQNTGYAPSAWSSLITTLPVHGLGHRFLIIKIIVLHFPFKRWSTKSHNCNLRTRILFAFSLKRVPVHQS